MEKPTINEQLIAHEIKHTPFTVVEHQNETAKEFLIVCGNQVVCETKFQTLEAAKRYIRTKPYELIFATTIYLIKKMEEMKND